MKENEINKSNRIKIFVLVMLTLLVSVAGISYAYFTIQITGNDTASSMRLRTANMQLVYNDVQIVSGEYATPGWSDDKTLTVTNTGNVTEYYTIIWRDLINEVTDGELVISAECSSSSGTCDDLDETAVPTYTSEMHNVVVKGNIEIAPGVTHTYTLTAEFIETGSNQNYNQNKYFNGTLNIEEYRVSSMVRMGMDTTIGLPIVRITTESSFEEFYDLTNAINYSLLINNTGNIYNYAADKSILFAKYNLYVGQKCTSSNTDDCSRINSSVSGYGLQSANANGRDGTYPAMGVVPFSGSSSTNGYWYTGSGLNSKYGTSYSNSNIYDKTFVTAPNFNANFSSNAGNANYSIAYYVEAYVRKLGIEGTGRLLTYSEASTMSQTKITNGQYYWLGTAATEKRVESVNTDGQIGMILIFQYIGIAGVRPVIVVNTSDIQSS